MSEYHHLAENSPAALVLVRLNGTIIAANNAACRLLGLYRQQMEQLTVDQWLARPIERTRDALAHIRASSGTYIDVTLRHGEGFEFSAQLSSRVFEHPAHGRVAGIVLRFNAALATSGDEDADVAQVALDHIDEAAVLLDSNTRIRALNPAYTRITGYDEAAALGQSLELGAARHGADSWDGLIEAMSPGERWTGEVQNRRRNGELYPAYVKITALAPSARARARARIESVGHAHAAHRTWGTCQPLCR